MAMNVVELASNNNIYEFILVEFKIFVGIILYKRSICVVFPVREWSSGLGSYFLLKKVPFN